MDNIHLRLQPLALRPLRLVDAANAPIRRGPALAVAHAGHPAETSRLFVTWRQATPYVPPENPPVPELNNRRIDDDDPPVTSLPPHALPLFLDLGRVVGAFTQKRTIVVSPDGRFMACHGNGDLLLYDLFYARLIRAIESAGPPRLLSIGTNLELISAHRDTITRTVVDTADQQVTVNQHVDYVRPWDDRCFNKDYILMYDCATNISIVLVALNNLQAAQTFLTVTFAALNIPTPTRHFRLDPPICHFLYFTAEDDRLFFVVRYTVPGNANEQRREGIRFGGHWRGQTHNLSLHADTDEVSEVMTTMPDDHLAFWTDSEGYLGMGRMPAFVIVHIDYGDIMQMVPIARYEAEETIYPLASFGFDVLLKGDDQKLWMWNIRRPRSLLLTAHYVALRKARPTALPVLEPIRPIIGHNPYRMGDVQKELDRVCRVLNPVALYRQLVTHPRTRPTSGDAALGLDVPTVFETDDYGETDDLDQEDDEEEANGDGALDLDEPMVFDTDDYDENDYEDQEEDEEETEEH